MAMNLKHHIGLRVKSARLKAGITQEQLAEKIGKSVETVSNLERGHYMTSVETLHHVSEALKVSLVYFFKGVGVGRAAPKVRLERELELQRLAEELTFEELDLAIRLVKGIKT